MMKKTTKKVTKKPNVLLCAVLCLLLLPGCIGGTSKSSRFYLLTPIAEVQSSAVPRDVSVRISAVELPKHLRDPEIVTRVDEAGQLRHRQALRGA